MFKTITSGILWLARGTSVALGLAVMLAVVLGVASTALGANRGDLILGQNNVATAFTQVVGNVNGNTLQLANTNPGTNDSALSLNVQPGEAPLRVDSDARVPNLNADKLDGLEPSQIEGVKAYAYVDPRVDLGGAPGFVAPQTEGFTSVERVATGDYCLRAPGLNPANSAALVSVDFRETQRPETLASALNDPDGCEGGQFRVVAAAVGSLWWHLGRSSFRPRSLRHRRVVETVVDSGGPYVTGMGRL